MQFGPILRDDVEHAFDVAVWPVSSTYVVDGALKALFIIIDVSSKSSNNNLNLEREDQVSFNNPSALIFTSLLCSVSSW